MSDQSTPTPENLVLTYFKALNTSDADLAASLYAPNGVFMGNKSATCAGDEVRGAYDRVFGAIRLDLGFELDEASVHGSTAIVRTKSQGAITLLHDGTIIDPAVGRELFVLRRTNQNWRIAAFMFNEIA